MDALPRYDDGFEFDDYASGLDIDHYTGDEASELSSIVAAFDPVFEPELLVEYLRVWAASSRTHASDLFDDVVAIDTESVACLEVQRLIETRVERRVQVPGNAILPTETYDGTIARMALESTADLVPTRIEAIKRGSEQPVACSCRDGSVGCHACGGTGRDTSAAEGGPSGCIVCGSTGIVAHETCRGAGVLREYTHGTITRDVDATCVMTHASAGMDKARDSDWYETDIDPGRVIAVLPHEVRVQLAQAWEADPSGTAARFGVLSMLQIYRVRFRRNGRERLAWLVGSQLRVVVPGAVGRVPNFPIKRAISLAMTLASLSYWGYSQMRDDAATQPPDTRTQAGMVEPSAPVPAPAPEVKRVAIPSDAPPK